MMYIQKKIIGRITMTFLLAAMCLSPVYAALGDQTLMTGMGGRDVTELQSKLISLGYDNITVDGIFGKDTKQAVIKLQKAKNTEPDGIVGQKTLQYLVDGRQPQVSRASAPKRYKAAFDVKATAYAPGPHDNGKWGNLTHLGTQIRPGVIAVDPRIIPLRSRLLIEFADGKTMDGVAEDTGGAIKGNRIDIAMPSVAQAYKFGIQPVKVYILS